MVDQSVMWIEVVLLTAGGLVVAGLLVWVWLLRRERNQLRAVLDYLGHAPPAAAGRHLYLIASHGKRVAADHRKELMAGTGAVVTGVVGVMLLWPNGEELPEATGPEPSPPPTLTTGPAEPTLDPGPETPPTVTREPTTTPPPPAQTSEPSSPSPGSNLPPERSSDTTGAAPPPTGDVEPEPSPELSLDETAEPEPSSEPPEEEPRPDEPPSEPPPPDDEPSPDDQPEPPPDDEPTQPPKGEPKESKICVPPVELPKHVEICISDPTGLTERVNL